MKKIMFNDKYGLTQAVLEGRKTMTRRWAKTKRSPYKPGEIVAVAQSYKDAGLEPTIEQSGTLQPAVGNSAGWKNKMFVQSWLMPHKIRITNVRVERLQDIGDEECLREGIYEVPFCEYAWEDNGPTFGTPREAFASLIDKVSGKGTWDKNRRMFVYEFELVR